MANFLARSGAGCGSNKAVVALAGLLALAAPSKAEAACAQVIIFDATSAATSNVADIAAMGLLVNNAFGGLMDALQRLANQGSNDVQNQANALSIISDKHAAEVSSEAISEVRTEMATQFQPSRTVCRTASRHVRVVGTLPTFNAVRDASQKESTNFATNAPGTASEKGTLAALNQRFTDRCTKYANRATMMPPPGINCTGPSDTGLVDLDIQPWKALIDPINFRNTAYRDAATDAVAMLTDIAPPDPLRGPALSRTDGQNLHMLRMRDVTRMNLARGVLQDMVAMRSEATITDANDGNTTSRLGRYIELVTDNTILPGDTLSQEWPVIMASGEVENSAVQLIGARLATQQALVFELMRLTEQIVAVEAVQLAIKVERSRAGNPGVATRVIQSN